MKKRLRRALGWLEDRTGLGAVTRKLARHVVPRKVGWGYVFGSATLFVFITQIITGVALASFYVPSAESAFASLRYIEHEAYLGWLVRGIHYVGASAMVILVGIHMVRVFLTGSFKFPREVSWLSGVILLFLTLGMGFTGQLLRWDDNGVWTVVVAAQQAGRTPFIGDAMAHAILGGAVVSGATLSRFFSMHVFLIPGLMFALLGLHLFLVFRNGISEPPDPDRPVDPATYRAWYERLLDREGVPFWPHAAWRDLVFGAFAIGTVVLLAWAIRAPAVTEPPDPSMLHVNPRPDWYLLWYFAVLSLIPASLEDYVIIGAPLVGIVVLLAVPFVAGRGHRHPLRRPWALGTVAAGLVGLAALTVVGIEAPWSPDFSATALPASSVASDDPRVQRGAELVHSKGCLYCHTIDGDGGHRGPDLSTIGDRLDGDQLTIRIMNGAHNMPSFARQLDTDELDDIVAFLETRRAE